MPVFHARSRRASTTATTPPSLQRLEAALGAQCERGPGADGFESFEREVHALFVQAEREVLAEGLERLDVDVPYVVIDGRKHSRVLRASETYTSAVGPVTVTRTLYRAGRAKALAPLELRAGIVEGSRSLRAEAGLSCDNHGICPVRRGVGSRLPAEESVVKCMYCQGEMHRGAAPFHVDRKGYRLLLDSVPAWVCSQCGESYFEEPEVDSIQEAIRALDSQATTLASSA